MAGSHQRPPVHQLVWMGLRALLISVLVGGVWLALHLVDPNVRVEVTQLVEYDGLARIYYSDGPLPYTETRSRRWAVDGGEWRVLTAWLPGFERHSRVRIDPSNRRGLIVINRVAFESEWTRIVLRGEALVDAGFMPRDLLLVSVDTDGVRWVSVGDDPHFSLALPRELYWPDAHVAVWLLLRVMLVVFVLWVLLERLWWWHERHHPRRNQALRDAAHDLPRALGWQAVERPARLIGLLALVLLPLLVATQFQIARITPFFQGPNEAAQTVNTFASFDRLLGAGLADCQTTWPALAAVESVTARLVQQPMVSIRQFDVERLADVAARSPLADAVVEPVRQASCANSNLFFDHAGNALAIPFSLLLADADVLDYLQWVRQGQSLLSALLILLTVLVIAKGRWVPSRDPALALGPLRVWLFLAVIAWVAIPQHLYLGSVVGATALLVPFGLFVSIAFLFRVPVLTELGLLLSLIALLPQHAAYLLPLVLLLGWYLALWLRQRWRLRWAVHALVVMVVALAALLPLLVGWLSGLRDVPVDVSARLLMLEDPLHVLHALARHAAMFGSLASFDWARLFGPLDAELPTSGVVASRVLLLVLAGLLVWALIAERKRRPWRGWWRRSDGAPGEAVFMAVVAIPLVVLLTAIVADTLHAVPDPEWGQILQGRYLLPILFPLLAAPFLAHAALLGGDSPADIARQRRIGAALIVLLATLGGVLAFTTVLLLSTLANRYFESPEVMARYLELLLG